MRSYFSRVPRKCLSNLISNDLGDKVLQAALLEKIEPTFIKICSYAKRRKPSESSRIIRYPSKYLARASKIVRGRSSVSLKGRFREKPSANYFSSRCENYVIKVGFVIKRPVAEGISLERRKN